MKKILLLYTVYEIKENEIENIKYLIDNTRSNNEFIDIAVVSDNPNINDDLRLAFEEKDCILKESNKNIGKYQLVKNFLIDYKESCKETANWVKVCDPDDIILLEELENFLIFLSTNNVDPKTFIRLNPVKRLQKGNHSLENVNKNKKTIVFSGKDMLPGLFVNENSVIPIDDIINFELNAQNQTKSSDVLFSLAHFHKKENIVIEYGPTFYVYNFRNGLTGTESFNEDLFNQLISFLKIMVKYKNENKMMLPGNFDFLWSFNSLVESNYSFDEKLSKLEFVHNLLSNCGKDDWATTNDWNSKTIEEFKKNLKKGIKLII